MLTINSGNIYVDGLDLNSISKASWRAKIGYVSQEPFIFNNTVAENIKIGKINATTDEIEISAQLAQASHFIKKLPDEFNTFIGKGGVGLSGGQKQRIALSQAFVKKPEILILDEATNGLDIQTENELFKSVKKSFANCLTILVTHRLSSLQNVDEIIYLKDGKISEFGSFESLYSKNGDFTNLINNNKTKYN